MGLQNLSLAAVWEADDGADAAAGCQDSGRVRGWGVVYHGGLVSRGVVSAMEWVLESARGERYDCEFLS